MGTRNVHGYVWTPVHFSTQSPNLFRHMSYGTTGLSKALAVGDVLEATSGSWH